MMLADVLEPATALFPVLAPEPTEAMTLVQVSEQA